MCSLICGSVFCCCCFGGGGGGGGVCVCFDIIQVHGCEESFHETLVFLQNLIQIVCTTFYF